MMHKILLLFTFLLVSQAVYPEIISIKNKPIYITFVTMQGCHFCLSAENELSKLKKNYKNIVIDRFSVKNNKGFEIAQGLEQKYKLKEKEIFKVPVIYIGNRYLSQSQITYNNIIKLINSENERTNERPWKKIQVIKKDYSLDNFSIFAIIATGIADGFNPCAFATLIFLLSYLTILKKNRKQLIVISSFFCLTIFISYFFLGIGLFSVLQSLVSNYNLINFVYKTSAIIAIILGLIHLYDAYNSKHKKSENILKLSSARRNKINKIIRRNILSYKFLVPSVIIIGFSISILELGCTGQLYIPIITYILRTTQFSLQGIFYLLIYNLAFILPLIFILLTYIYGCKWQTINSSFKKNIYLLKILLGIVLICIGILLL